MKESCTDRGFISVRGAREHNLRGVDLDIPRDKLVVFTGVSGSGKSSLAFDTLYAEGQRRYVESLSTYARQFLGQMDKPHYDAIRGLTPTIAVSQHTSGRNPRSTVGTLTEVQDYLRVLMARAGVQHCPSCGDAVRAHSAAEIVLELKLLLEGTRFLLLSPVSREAQTELPTLLDEVRKAGFTRVRLDGMLCSLDEPIPARALSAKGVDVVVDRLVRKPDMEERLSGSVETALQAGRGRLIVAILEDGEIVSERPLSERATCLKCSIDLPELSPASFSFNSPAGACPDCKGLGFRADIDPKLLVPDPTLTLHQGAIHPWRGPLTKKDSWNYQMILRMAEGMGFSLDVPWKDLPKSAQDALLYGSKGELFEVEWEGSRHRKGKFEIDWEGCIPAMERRMRDTKSEAMQGYYMEYLSDARCRTCQGSRLRPESAAVRIGAEGGEGTSFTLVELSRMPIRTLQEKIEGLDLRGSRRIIAEEILKEILKRLRFLDDVGLGYLELDRGADTLSGGESQRIRLAAQLGGELCGVTYILDEPSIGLHPRDTGRLARTLLRLRDLGNSVIVVEHDRETMQAADWIVDFGPGAGTEGGRVIFSGSPQAIQACPDSLTGQYLAGTQRIPVPETPRAPGPRKLRILGAREHNLKNIDVEIPLGLMVAITGVSGAGKSSLIKGILSPALHNALQGARQRVGDCESVRGIEHLRKIISVDQGSIGRSPRSNPATYTKLFEAIRDLFAETREARVRGYAPSRFSFNQKGGRCEACSGDGWRRIEMHFLPDVLVRCELCKGQRFNEATLAVRFKGRNIAEVLEMTVDEALPFFTHHPEIHSILSTLSDVGLGYVRLGQPSDTLSGGEAQRIKLSRELARVSSGDTLYLLDEPTTGLHFDDVRKLLMVLHRLVDAGNTVLIVEHNPDVIRACDWVVDLGPEGGEGGGRLVACGTPAQLSGIDASHTGRALRNI